MKILFILPEYYPHSSGGISTYYINYIKALRPYCERIKVIVGSGFYHAENSFEVDGAEVETLKPDLYNAALNRFTQFNITPEVRNNLAAAWAMYEQANKGEGFDIIECTDFGLGFIPWVINHNKPVVTRLHGSAGQIALHENEDGSNALSNAFVKQTELLLLPLCDLLITHSDNNRTYWNNLLNTYRVVKINPVFNVDNESPLLLSEREPHGLVTARIQRWKGPVELCKAVTLIEKSKRPAIKWFGKDMHYSANQTTSKYLAESFAEVWGNNISAEGAVPNNLIAQHQRKAKFGVIPSTWDMYNFSGLEFLACGTPVICSDGAGVSDIIEHGKNGFKYPANDVNALADCLKKMIDIGEDEYHKMCALAIQSVITLNAKIIIPQNIEQYKLVLNKFTPQTVNEYFNSIYAPRDTAHSIDEILDHQPLKKLLRYTLKRVTQKIRGKK